MIHEPEQWKKQYERDGYLVVEDVLEPKLLKNLRTELDRITADPDSLPENLKRWIDFERDYAKKQPHYNDLTSEQVGNAIRNIMELPRFNPIFCELICHKGLLDILETIYNSTEFSFHNYKCIVKARRVSSRFRWHRDLPYLQHSTPNLITAMLCLDDMTESNGATVVMPGTHRIPHEDVKASDMDIPDDQLPPGERVTVKCPAGSAVLFHVNIVHGGGANRSDMLRRNIIGIWAGPDTYSIIPYRFSYQDVMPRSTDPARQRQLRMTFPHLFQLDRSEKRLAEAATAKY